MGKQKKRENILLSSVEIIDTANKGRSVVKYDGRAIFIRGGVPGDICDISIFKKRKKYWEANINKIHKYSDKRTDPKCEHFGICGGCKWQNMKYKSQLEYKQNEVFNNLKRIGRTNLPISSKIIGAEKKYYYRNKM